MKNIHMWWVVLPRDLRHLKNLEVVITNAGLKDGDLDNSRSKNLDACLGLSGQNSATGCIAHRS